MIDPVPLAQFTVIAILTTYPNYLFQCWLEQTFPTKRITAIEKEEKEEEESRDPARISISNTVVKFLLEQSVGASANTIVFIVLTSLLSGKNSTQMGIEVEKVG